jgi:nucleoredoxin
MQNFLQSLGNSFVSKDGENNGASLKSAQLIGLYLSAHWCPPCKQFTPVLAEFYKQVNASGKVFEVVFVSFDNDDQSFKNYLSTMPWIAITHGSSEIQA